ncbi:outer membrane lipoprotein LolB [Mizugakiibacter sediminis]|uniref:Outer-membrane lipoprotein LolB n=1 Tax=Mizugakiibacter sediminis TaxID=1475481 RepID=A0A0K8QP92_9GAMM|nr:lipoprotein insertase outer membrane protein LolB [Mizugakiibacter sediminis]GAP66699.1 outer membrane lipoprotein LolB [Mizugakiibacter sediminis]
MRASLRARRLPAALILLALAACAPVAVRRGGDAELLAAQAARERALAPLDRWSLTARIVVSNGKDGGSGTLEWMQDGAEYTFVVRAPVTGKSFRLQGGPDGAVLEGLDTQPLRDADAERLLARELGWHVPLAELAAWVRGLRAQGPAELAFGADGLPSTLEQDGWRVEYRDWYTDRQPPLPQKVFAERAPYRVRVAIERWQLP